MIRHAVVILVWNLFHNHRNTTRNIIFYSLIHSCSLLLLAIGDRLKWQCVRWLYSVLPRYWLPTSLRVTGAVFAWKFFIGSFRILALCLCGLFAAPIVSSLERIVRRCGKHQVRDSHSTVGQNNQEYRLKYWAIRLSVRSHHSLVHLLRTAPFARALRCAHFSHSPARGTVNDDYSFCVFL